MDLTGSQNQDTDPGGETAQQRQARQFEQLYEGSTLMVNGEPHTIEEANLNNQGIELKTAEDTYQIIIEQ